MNSKRERETGAGLPLPSPRSPRELDERILDHARRHAPRKQRRAIPTWASGMAAAGIVGIALLITLPQNPAPVGDVAESLSPRQAQTKERELGTAALRDPAPQRKAKAESPPRQAMSDALHDRGLDGAASPPAPAAEQVAEPSAANTADSEQQRWKRELGTFYLDQLAVSVRHCAALKTERDNAAARECYQNLRQNCPVCDLPATLEEALALAQQKHSP